MSIESGSCTWRDGSIYEWNCPHVSKNSVLVRLSDGSYEKWNTDYPEPKLPYEYIHLQALIDLCDLNVELNIRSYEECECKKEER